MKKKNVENNDQKITPKRMIYNYGGSLLNIYFVGNIEKIKTTFFELEGGKCSY